MFEDGGLTEDDRPPIPVTLDSATPVAKEDGRSR